MGKASVCKTDIAGSEPALASKGIEMTEEEAKEVKATIDKIVNQTPQIFSVNDLVGLNEDDEDIVIYERRCYESERRMKD